MKTSRPIATSPLICAFTAAFAFGAPLAAQGVLYRATDLGTVNYPSSRAIDINDHGEILVISNWPERTYVYDPASGQLVDIGAPPGNSRFEGTDINNSGQVVGKGLTTNGLYVYTPGAGFQDLGRLSPGQPAAGQTCGINDRGEVVGSALGLAAGPEPFLWTPSAGMQPVAPGITGYLCDLNESGEAIGRIGNDWVYWVRSSGATGLAIPLTFTPETLQADGTVASYSGGQILLRDRFGRMTTLPGVPVQHTGASVTGRGSDGVICGNWQYYVISGSSVIWYTGTYLHVPGRGTVDLTQPTNGIVDPAWEVRILFGMNRLGQMVGFGGLRGTNANHAIRLDPVSPVAARSVVGQGCSLTGAATPALASGLPLIGRPLDFQISGAAVNNPGALVLGFPAPTPTPIGSCMVYLDRNAPMATFALMIDGAGMWNGTLDLPPSRLLLGVTLAAQGAVLLPGALQVTNGVVLTMGF